MQMAWNANMQIHTQIESAMMKVQGALGPQSFNVWGSCASQTCLCELEHQRLVGVTRE